MIGSLSPRGIRRMAACLGFLLVALPLTASVAHGGQEGDENSPFSAEDIEFFERQVRPILVERCYECHSRKVAEPKGGLRVDSREALLKGGDTGPAVVPQELQKSLLIDAINYGELYQMPPKTRLPAAEVKVLTDWVKRGAPWPREQVKDEKPSESFNLEARRDAHWCWQPVREYPLPIVKQTSWIQQDLDRFVLAKLEGQGLSPAPPDDKRALIRRAYFDLIGLPPPPDEVERFVHDHSPRAFERIVDQLLASPHFGERWARHWMDVVRYAETCGHEFDYPIHHAWRYRDYLVRAFNADVSYDRFVLEHIAGDLLPDPRRNPIDGANESILGTGSWYLYEATHAPVDVLGDYAGRVDNQIDVFSKAFLGLTVACARCHDHKFDAISTKDYYALAGYIHSSRRQEAMLDPGGRIRETARQLANARDSANAVNGELAARAAAMTPGLLARCLLAAGEVMFGEPERDEAAPEPGQRRNLHAVAKSNSLPHDLLRSWVEALADPALEATEHPLHTWKKLAGKSTAPAEEEFAAWRQETQQAVDTSAARSKEYEKFADFDQGDYRGWYVSGEAFDQSPTTSGQWDLLADGAQLVRPGVAHSGQLSPRLQGVLRSPNFTIGQRNIFYRLTGKGCEVRLIIDGYTMVEFHQLLFGGVKFNVESKTPGQFRWHRQSGDLGMYAGHRAYIEILDYGDGWAAIDEIWFSDQNQPPPEAGQVPFLNSLTADPPCNSLEQLARRYGDIWTSVVQRWRDRALTADDTSWVNWMLRHRLLGEDFTGTAVQAVESARRQATSLSAILSAPPRVLAMADGPGVNAQVSIRGNPRTLGDVVPRHFLSALGDEQVPTLAEEGSGRMSLARQVASPTNPLTASVLVNRLWHHMLGRGIVSSVDNFGVLGERPTHPELLDHLAFQFLQEGWSIKRTLRRIALSATYQMSNDGSAQAREIDPTSRLFHAARIRRLEGEAIRDAMLQVSGRLDGTVGGPGVAVHITPFMDGRGKPRQSGPLDGAGRRSIYVEVRRNFLPPMMLAFDTPIPFSTVGRRNVSNVPAQALMLMNDPFVIKQAERWAAQLLADSSLSPTGRIQRAYLTAFARPPLETEVNQAMEFFAIQGAARNQTAEQSLQDQSVWSDFCHVLFNVKEFVYLK